MAVVSRLFSPYSRLFISRQPSLDIIYDKKTFYIQKAGEYGIFWTLLWEKGSLCPKKVHIISWFGHEARKDEENVQNLILSRGDHDSYES